MMQIICGVKLQETIVVLYPIHVWSCLYPLALDPIFLCLLLKLSRLVPRGHNDVAIPIQGSKIRIESW